MVRIDDLPVLRGALVMWVILLLPAAALSQSGPFIDWVIVGDPGNAADDTGFGAVATAYRIGEFEVTNAQYVEFLNAKAASDPLELWPDAGGGIQNIGRIGSPGSYTYLTSQPSRAVHHVDFYDALRFANWLHNGRGNGDTETGAYTLLGGTPLPSNFSSLTRNPGAEFFVPSEDEWYKAAYYDALSESYFDYPAGSDTQIVCAAAGPTPNTAACGGGLPVNPSVVGSYTGSASPYGTFDQGGNVAEWTEGTIPSTILRVLRGGSKASDPSSLGASSRVPTTSTRDDSVPGFRVASRLPDVPSMHPIGLYLALPILLAVAALMAPRRRGSGR